MRRGAEQAAEQQPGPAWARADTHTDRHAAVPRFCFGRQAAAAGAAETETEGIFAFGRDHVKKTSGTCFQCSVRTLLLPNGPDEKHWKERLASMMDAQHYNSKAAEQRLYDTCMQDAHTSPSTPPGTDVSIPTQSKFAWFSFPAAVEVRRSVLQDSGDLLWLILHHVHDSRTLLRAARVCVAWRCAAYDDDVWRARCLKQWTLTAQAVSRPDVHTPNTYQQLSARLTLANRRVDTTPTLRQLALMPAQLRPPAPVRREDYMVGVELHIEQADGGAPAVYWSRLCELTGADSFSVQTENRLKRRVLESHVLMDAIVCADAIAVQEAGNNLSSVQISVFLLRKKDSRLLILGDREHMNDGRWTQFSLRNTGISGDVGNLVHVETVVYDNHTGTMADVLVSLDTDEDGWMDEMPVSTVDTLLQLLEAPAFADRWAPAVPNMASVRATKPIAPTTTPKTAWRQIESTTALLGHILGYLTDAKELSLAGEVSWSWYLAAQGDITWQRVCQRSVFPLFTQATHRQVISFDETHRQVILNEFDLSVDSILNNPSWMVDQSWKGLFAQRILANKAAATSSTIPLIPKSGWSEFLVGLEVSNTIKGERTVLRSTLTDISNTGSDITDLHWLDVPASAWVPTADFNPQLSVSMIRKRDGKILILGRDVEGDREDNWSHRMFWRLQHTDSTDVPFWAPHFDATIFYSPKTRELELQQPLFGTSSSKTHSLATSLLDVQPSQLSWAVPLSERTKRWQTAQTHKKVSGLTVAGVLFALDNEYEIWNGMVNMNQLLHALESPALAQRWV